MNVLRYISESNLIEGVTCPGEVQQSLVAWEYLRRRRGLTHEVIWQTHSLVMLNQGLASSELGCYRDRAEVNVSVGEYVPPPWQYVRALMDEWLHEYRDRDPWDKHVGFESIHPFVDGNGRVGRMLLWWQQLKVGQEPRLILAAEKQAYYWELGQARRNAGYRQLRGARSLVRGEA